MDKILKHEHLLVKAFVKKPFMDEETVKTWLIDLVHKVGMVVAAGPIASYVTTPGNRGITAAINLATSHAVLHSWDELEIPMVQFDIYSCSTIDLDVVWEHFAILEPVTISYKFLDREFNFNTVISEGTMDFE